MKHIILILSTIIGFGLLANTSKPDTQIKPDDKALQLSEIVVHSKKRQVLHILAFVRDYSTLSTYTDTVTLFREKWVDFMLPFPDAKGFTGWRLPRIIDCKSYYRFTNSQGLDSVSDRFNQHFSWTDWIGIIDRVDIPATLKRHATSSETLFGHHSPTETWQRSGNDISLSVDVLAHPNSQRWAPGFTPFFHSYLDFEKFIINYDFSNVDTDDKVYARDLTGISCIIESRGRGRDMFMFNRRDEPFFVTTYSDIYIVDREYISVGEAKKWRDRKSSGIPFDIYVPTDVVPPTPPDMAMLVDRVNNIDHVAIRLATKIDKRLGANIDKVPLTTKQKVIKYLKSLIGLR